MPDGILFSPDNRQLSGAASDFSLFGAQPAVQFAAGPAREQPVGDSGTSAAAPAAAGTAQRGADDQAPKPADDSEATAGAVDEPNPSSTYPPLTPQHMESARAPDGIADGLATGSSTPPSILSGSGIDPMPAGHQYSTSSFNADVSGHALNTSLSIAVAADSELSIGHRADLLTVPQVGAAAVHDALTDATAGLDATIHAATLALDDASDSIDLLAGTDPTAGIATLLGLVETHEMTVSGPTIAADTIDSASSILDTLAADMPGDALLGHDQPDHPDALAPIINHHDDTGLLGGV